jgi:hypothetical protein
METSELEIAFIERRHFMRNGLNSLGILQRKQFRLPPEGDHQRGPLPHPAQSLRA